MSKLTGLHEAISRLDEVWADAGDSNDLSREQLIAVTNAIGVLQRRLDAVHVGVAAGIASESRAELGADSLAKQHGFRSPAKLIAASTGVSTGDAIRLINVGEATAARTDLLGARLPAKYPLVSEALEAGTLSAQAAALIIAVLERCRIAAGPGRTAEGEKLLVDAAPGLGLDEVRRLGVRIEAWLDPDGVEPREDEQCGKRSLTFFERGGRLHLNGNFDVETGAPIVAALRGYVSAAFAARKAAPDPDAPDADRRTVPMLQADALALFCAHVLGCKSEKLPLAGATVVVRMHVDDLDSATGTATIDGIDQPISAAAARRMAADGGVIPCVLGGDSEILDWGRKKRFFTKAQRLALAERDGGCAMCNLSPEMVKAHHMRWWKRHHGRTDLSNGILLCDSCHHRIHDNGWDIRIDGTGVDARVWFIPPVHVDPARTPRLGGRARFDIAA
ncbi:HNH endonuclease signature motif containing protein [Microbacterium sp. KRD172]|uniref:HNH endonuclease signature motif containing protein n=1 Tax=Microbacterium sp. KRD172 TaxID=2729727 RepID=UPI0019D0F596|nr:HNH endonuclease signature motif containing protein [Microbacterium sp. KRD172]